jgi:hypothetical protein
MNINRKAAKTMKVILATPCACLAVASLTTTAHAIPVTYTYIGDNYATIDREGPGCTATDHITVSFTMDSSYWGTSINQRDFDLSLSPFGLPENQILSSGPWLMGFETAKLSTDSFGHVLSWGFFCAFAGLDISTGGNADGSGLDIITLAGRRLPGTMDSQFGEAYNHYPAGHVGNWSMAIGSEPVESVPDPGNSLGLLALALVGLCLPHSRTKSSGTV